MVVVEAISNLEFLIIVSGRFTFLEVKVATAITTVVYALVGAIRRTDAVILIDPLLALLATAFGDKEPLSTVSRLLVRKALGRILDTLDVASVKVPFLIGISLRAMCHYGPIIIAPLDTLVIVVVEPNVIVPARAARLAMGLAATFAWGRLAASTA
jgi:hypothetical protein